MHLAQSILNVLLPTPCALCGKRGAPVCRACRSAVEVSIRETHRYQLQGWAITDYGDAERTLLKSFKEEELTSLTGFLGGLIAPALREVASQLGVFYSPHQPTFLVPMPSSRANYVKRGFIPAKLLATEANRIAGKPFEVRSLLRFNRVVEDQAKLSGEQRITNLAGSMSARVRLPGAKVLLFDDVVTTGATIQEAARALTEAGAEVVGFLVFSETLLKTHTKS